MRGSARHTVQLLLLIAALLLAGCVTSVETPVAETVLMVSKSGHTATLRWESAPNAVYTVLYAPKRSAGVRWQPLPGFERVRGTGRTITITDKIPPRQSRHYRLRTQLVERKRR